ncbi:pro-resilin-like [Cherax quadricarinatus]|uniref:pro-resilin-like n=1 Tax=Cherax quadricarinatus TaxID=27406 RepID=UPI0023782CFC|nr:pro-resilin-like [Cherax quadricarinatus]
MSLSPSFNTSTSILSLQTVALVLSVAVMAAARAAPQGYGVPGVGGSGGSGDQYASAPANYNFQWEVSDSTSGNDFGHGEQANNGVVQGRYYVRLPDTRLQNVEYTADGSGYHPVVTYEGQAQFGGGGGKGSGQAGGYYP